MITVNSTKKRYKENGETNIPFILCIICVLAHTYKDKFI